MRVMLPKILSPTFTGSSVENMAPAFRVTHHDLTDHSLPKDAAHAQVYTV